MGKQIRARLFVVLVLVFLSACGRKGPILPPYKKIPEPVINLSVRQEGWDLKLKWRNPTSFIDGNPLPETTELELWMYSEPDPADPATIKAKAKAENKETDEKNIAVDDSKTTKTQDTTPVKIQEKIEIKTGEEGKEQVVLEQQPMETAPLVTVKIIYPGKEDFEDRGQLLKVFQIKPPKPTDLESTLDLPREYTHTLIRRVDLRRGYAFALRVRSGKRTSVFSDVVTIEPEAVSVPPPFFTAAMEKDRIVLKWEAPKSNIDGSTPAVLNGYNIYREDLTKQEENSAAEEPDKDVAAVKPPPEAVRINSAVWTQSTYEHTTFEWNQSYRYTVRTVFSEESSRFESGDSIPVEIAAVDIFPPAAPAGLVAVVGGGLVSVSWSSVKETDVSGYRIWRKAPEDEDFVLLTNDPVSGNSFSDKNAGAVGIYLYAVTAVDLAGNESLKSIPVEVRVRENVP